jgi:hypothetical protein
LVLNAKVNHDLVVAGALATVQYNLVTTAGTDYNHVMLPLGKGTLTTTALLGADIGSNTYTNSIQKWNSATQAYANSSFSFGSWKNVFNTYIGDHLIVNMTNPKTWPTVASKTEDIVGSDWNADTPKGGSSRVVWITIADETGTPYLMADAEVTVTWKAWMTARPLDIIHSNTVPSGYAWEDVAGDGNLNVTCDLSDFAGVWAAGDVLNIVIKDETTNNEVQLALPIDNSGDPYFCGYDTPYSVTFDNPGAPTHDFSWLAIPSSIEDNMLPLETKLHQNYPNPFNPTTTIKFDLASAGKVQLNVYNYTGQLVKSLVNGEMKAGFQSVNFDASSLSAGVYYYTMQTAGKSMTQKMVLIK